MDIISVVSIPKSDCMHPRLKIHLANSTIRTAANHCSCKLLLHSSFQGETFILFLNSLSPATIIFIIREPLRRIYGTILIKKAESPQHVIRLLGNTRILTDYAQKPPQALDWGQVGHEDHPKTKPLSQNSDRRLFVLPRLRKCCKVHSMPAN